VLIFCDAIFLRSKGRESPVVFASSGGRIGVFFQWSVVGDR
jgi:hypothetical protein